MDRRITSFAQALTVGVTTLAVVALAATLAPAGATAQPSPTAPQASPASSTPYLSGLLSANAGDIFDSQGRAVLLHGVNAVYKRPPYVLYVAPGKKWNFDDRDAQGIAGLGLNMVRLGILWQGIEPGTVGPNNRKVCTKGTPGDPGQWNQAVADQYLRRVAQTVDLLGRYHVYSLLDMHQDVYSQVFRGEGFPGWAVCTSGRPLKAVGGRWSDNYGNKSLNAAFDNFWANDVVGNLQGEYDRSWAAVARAFSNNPWVLGYDPINEPFTTSLTSSSTPVADKLECFYTGRAHPGYESSGSPEAAVGPPLVCPDDVPAQGVIPSIQAGDPQHMIFIEPTIYEFKKQSNFIGPMPYPNLVINFHAYCGNRSPVTGLPYNEPNCYSEIQHSFFNRALEVTRTPSPTEQGSLLPGFLSEFGATTSRGVVSQATEAANLLDLGWAYWSWKYYDDPTGSSKEGLAEPDGRLNPQVRGLNQTYPEAVAGTVLTSIHNNVNDELLVGYVSDPKITAPTLIYVSTRLRKFGYCASVNGARVISAPNAPMLELQNLPTSPGVAVSVTQGRC